MLFDGWDIAILLVAGYVAVMALVRLMIGRRNALMNELRREAVAEQKRQRAAAQQKRREEDAALPKSGKPAAREDAA